MVTAFRSRQVAPGAPRLDLLLLNAGEFHPGSGQGIVIGCRIPF